MQPLTRDAKGFIEGITKYIQDEGKTSVLPKVQTILAKVAAHSQKETTAHVVSSTALTLEEQKRLEQILYTLVGHKVSLLVSIDEKLLGGLKIQIGDWIVDTSLQGQLEEMAEHILQ